MKPSITDKPHRASSKTLRSRILRGLAWFCTFAPFSAAYGQSGTAFRDYNGNGVKNGTGEQGVPGVIVKLFINGTTSPDELIGTDTTDISGNFNFATPDSGRAANPGEKVRVEFEIPANYGCAVSSAVDYVGTNGAVHGTAVQFVTGAATGVDLALNNPAEFVAGTNPKVFISCYSNGNPLAGGTTGQDPAFVMFNWQDNGVPPSHSSSTGANEPTLLARASEVGAIYGTAYSRPAQKVFASSVMRRHMGFGPLGPGGIYLINPTSVATDKTDEWLNLDAIGIATHNASGTYPANPGNNTSPVSTYVGTNIERGLQPNKNQPNTDAAAGDQVGKVSIGDIDISDDGRNLYVVNLYDRRLYEINLVDPFNPQAPTLANVANRVRSWPIADPGTAANEGEHRPWGLKYYRGKVYVGVTMSGQDISGNVVGPVSGTGNSQIGTSLSIHVMEFDPGVGSFTDIFAQSLNYNRERPWIPWGYFAGHTSRYFSGTDREVAEPILADIEFDDGGGMLLGLMDRKGQQYAIENNDYNGTLTNYEYATAGELLRANVTRTPTSCTYTLATRSGTTDYYDDNIVHPESLQGPLAVLPGGGDAMAVVLDPINIRSGGVIRYVNATGLRVASSAYEIFDDRFTTAAGFQPAIASKANGLGDIEVAGLPADIEIGNYVWDDQDRDGIQDPAEPGVAGVHIELYDITGATLLATTTTGIDGSYYFNSGNVVDGDVDTSGNQAGIKPKTNYVLCIAASDFTNSIGAGAVLNGALLTLPKVQGNGQEDLSDNDATIQGGRACIAFKSGTTGESNHNLDFGFFDVPMAGTCYLIANVTNVIRDDHGTPSVADDTFNFDVTVTGADYGPNWTSNPAPTSGGLGSYNTATSMGPFLVSDGPVHLNITDTTDGLCFTQTIVTPPAVLCSLNATIVSTSLDAKGTASTADDEFSVVVSVGGQGTSSTWKSDSTVATGNYLADTTFGPFPIAYSPITIGFEDSADPDCRTSIVITSPACAPITLSSTPAVLPAATIGTFYSATINAAGGTSTFTEYSVTSGTLPTGMTLNPTSGLLSGTPSGPPATSTVTITAKDSFNCIGSASFSIGVDCNTLGVTPANMPALVAGYPISQSFAATGATGTVNWALGTGSLPVGLLLNPTTGEISGMPTAAPAPPASRSIRSPALRSPSLQRFCRRHPSVSPTAKHPPRAAQEAVLAMAGAPPVCQRVFRSTLPLVSSAAPPLPKEQPPSPLPTPDLVVSSALALPP